MKNKHLKGYIWFTVLPFVMMGIFITIEGVINPSSRMYLIIFYLGVIAIAIMTNTAIWSARIMEEIHK